MKDVISILQSRIAKRAAFMNKEYVCVTYDDGSVDFKTMAQEPHHFDSIYHTAQQKTDKRILAEIVQLRRVQKDLVKVNTFLSHKIWNKHQGKAE